MPINKETKPGQNEQDSKYNELVSSSIASFSEIKPRHWMHFTDQIRIFISWFKVFLGRQWLFIINIYSRIVIGHFFFLISDI